ncbi:MAG: hypothetical protein K1W06_01190 [Lachnospiraceae bacterium]
MKKRIKPLLFLICMVSIAAMVHTMCSNARSSKTAYVALGDSIAAGYGLPGYSGSQETPPADSYQSVVSRFLKTDPVNFAVTGDDSTDCINILNSGKADEALSDAGIITISIGSNDLLKPFIEIAKEAFGITESNGSMDISKLEAYYAGFKDASLIDILAIANDFADKIKDNKVLHEKAQGFSSNFSKIIDILKEKAPEAEIYVTNIYNPYKDVMVLGNLADAYIKEINNAFTDNSESYTLIDVYTLFAKENLVNTKFDISDLGNINLDPHPSKKGHARIASAILDALNAKHAPSRVKVGQVKSTTKNTVIIKLSCPSGKSGYEIEFASSKNGKWKKLKDTSKNNNKIKSAKLKSGKTYYFRARSYNNLNGVKYYSGYSQVKKAKIK